MSKQMLELADRIEGLAHGAVLSNYERGMIVRALRSSAESDQDVISQLREREKKLLAEKIQDKKDLYDYCVRAEAAEDEVKRLRNEPQSAPLPADAIDSKPHPFRPATTEEERKSLLQRITLEGEDAVSNILFQSALVLPGEGSFAGMLWTIGEWIRTRHGASAARCQAESGK